MPGGGGPRPDGAEACSPTSGVVGAGRMLERLVPNGGLRSGGAEACSPSGDIVSGADATRGRMVPDGCGPRSGGDEAASAPGGVVGDAGAMHGWLLPRGVGGAGRMRGRSPLGGVVGGAGTTRGWLAPGGRPCLCDAAACSPPGGGGRVARVEAGSGERRRVARLSPRPPLPWAAAVRAQCADGRRRGRTGRMAPIDESGRAPCPTP